MCTVKLAACIFISLLCALGGLFAKPDAWYLALIKPVGTPPNIVFGPVWTTLYILIGISAWICLNKGIPRRVWGLYAAHWIFNTAWTPLFFGLHRLDISLLDILLLDAVVLTLVIQLWKYSRTSAYLLLPYMTWICYASYLNASFWFLNR